MNEKLTLEELTNFVNSETKNNESLYLSSIADNRKKNNFSERRIRDLVSKKMISPGFKDGRHVFYNQTHIDELLEYKAMQALGHTEQTIKLQKNSQISTLSGSSSLFDTIDSIEKRSFNKVDSSMPFAASSVLGSESVSNNQMNFDTDSMAYSRLYSLDKTTSDIPITETKIYQLSENINLTINNNVDSEELSGLEDMIKKIKKLYK